MSQLVSIFELGKFRLSSLAIFAVIAGLFLGARQTPEWPLIVACSLGTLLVAMGGNAFNMWYERDYDKEMPRTRSRPIPSGRVSPRTALIAAISSCVVGLSLLAIYTTWLATLLCAIIFITYVGVYTPMKRKSSLNTIVGAVPGALPPVVGYAAAGGSIDRGAVVLFLIVFFWQIPHFLAISWRYRKDYAAGGMKMLPVVDDDGRATSRQMLLYTAALVFVSFLPYGVRMAGGTYLMLAIWLNILFSVIVAIAAIGRFDTAMRQTFLVSIIYLPLLLGIMVLDRTML